jgi:mRNA interferase MazF
MTATMPSRPVIKRGDVVLALFPNSDHRTAKARPALVVQADGLGTGLPQIVTAMITSNLARAGHPSRVSIAIGSPQGQQSGLLTDSVVMTDNLSTVLENLISRVVGCLPMDEVETALKHTLGL